MRESIIGCVSEEQVLTAIFDSALAQSAAFLQPLADLAAKHFGAAVSILMVTPIGIANGNIEMRRYVLFYRHPLSFRA